MSNRPDPDLIRMALRELEEALAEAEHGAIDRRWGQRLALSILHRAGIAQQWQVREFWQLLAAEPDRLTGGEQMHNYTRATTLGGLLDNWHRAAGGQPPDLLWRRDVAVRCSGRVDAGVLADQAWGMCNRYQPGTIDHVRNLFGASAARRFNFPETVHPRDQAPIVRAGPDGLTLDLACWGFPVVLRGARGQVLKPKPVNNARYDKLGSYWREWAGPYNRCLIPCTRFAEAVGQPGRMTETWLSVASQPVFAWAGLWRNSQEWGTCYTGVMTDAAPELAHIHDRCPVILAQEDWQAWLTAPLAELRRFDRPWPASDMVIEATDQRWVSVRAQPSI